MSRSERNSSLMDDVTELAADEVEPTLLTHQRCILGRYELVYELGTGGMANVYLARVRGPGNFFKWFAIKRIHPHLARDPRFVEMFLDEARIAAAVHHPNVAHVFDLGEQGSEHFIAMEYLHGEHLGSVVVRTFRENGRFPYELAARIVAWAADGLHHAHELRDAHGDPLGLVHRDVSPQNIFITYDGAVKLTDFGIVKAANRITQTKTGSTKGKTAYMSPEQALGQPLDRRSDIFALGTVLWEVTTGRRLFKGTTEAQTLMRITSGKLRAPSSVVRGYPPDLERIVLRALAHRPGDRYPSAAAMARDLERFLAASGAPVGATQLTAHMQQLFVDRIALKERILRASPDTRPDISLPTPTDSSGERGLPDDVSQSKVRSPVRGPTEGRSRARWVAALAVATAVTAAVAGGWWLAAAPAGVVRIDSRPSGARVTVDGTAAAGHTPLVLRDVEEGRHDVKLELDGHESFETTFDFEGNRVELVYHLGPTAQPIEDLAAITPEGQGAQAEDESGGPGSDATGEPVQAGGNDGDAAHHGDQDPDGDEHATKRSPADDPTSRAVAREDAESTGTTQDRPSPTDARRARRGSRPARTAGRPEPSSEGVQGRAKLNLLSTPWATVTANGRELGSTPLLGADIPAGRVVLRLRAEGSGPIHTVVVRAPAGNTVSHSVDLR